MSYLASWYWDKGNFRGKNEDSFSLQRVRTKKVETAFLTVCDGIGGLPAGETASGFVTEQMTEWFFKEGIYAMRGRIWRRRTKRSALEALMYVQKKMEACEQEENICCGTTCTMALVKGNRFLILHFGDSRAYLIGKKEKRLTQDHFEGGALRRCMGAFGFQEPDVIKGRLRPGEILLLCTDGFCSRIPEGFFAGCFDGEESEPGVFYRRLKGVGSFLKAQGEKDNLTALLLLNKRREHDGT